MKHFIFNGIKSAFAWMWFNAAFSFLNILLTNTLYAAADFNFAIKILSIVVFLGILIGLCFFARIFYKFGKGSLYKFDKKIINLFSIVFVHIFILLFCYWFLFPMDTFILPLFGIYWDLSNSFLLSALLSFVPYVFIFLGLQKGKAEDDSVCCNR